MKKIEAHCLYSAFAGMTVLYKYTKSNTIKKTSITQTIKEFLAETLFSSKKAKDDPIKEKAKRASNRPKVTKHHFPVPEDKKFRNVTE